MSDARIHHDGRRRLPFLTNSVMGIKTRLSILTFLQFAVWGCYLVSLGQYLGAAGLGSGIPWFYAAGGFAALFAPALMGAVADRFVPAQRLLGLCHAVAAVMMMLTWHYGYTHPHPRFAVIFTLFALSELFFIPTVALCNSVSFALLKSRGLDPVRAFPLIRVWGTVGFVAAMWTVNSIWTDGSAVGFTLSESSPHAMQRFQYTVMQLFAAGVTGVVTAVYAACLPEVTVCRRNTISGDWRTWPVVGSLRLLGDARLLPFFLFSMLIGVALQINNGYVAPFLTHFRGMPEFAGTFGASNATLLSSLSQISEALWILPVGCVLARAGVKRTVAMAIFAWVANFALFAMGDTGRGIWLIVGAMLVYGVAFDFFNVAGALFIDRQAPASDRSAAQGLLMMMTKGVGASVGMIVAGWVVNRFCRWEIAADGQRYFMGDWSTVWWIFAGYCMLVLVAFVVCFRISGSDRNCWA